MAGKLAVDRGWAINEEASTTAQVTGEGAFVLTLTSLWPLSFCSKEWKGSPGLPSSIWMLIREMDTNVTSWMTGGSSSWICIIATYIQGMDSQKEP